MPVLVSSILKSRKCRLAPSFEAAADVKAKGIDVNPEVMVPLVGYKREFELQAEVIHRTAAEVKKEKGVEFDYLVGTMIELPRAALTAHEIAESRGFLQLRHQRFDPNLPWFVARRFGWIHGRLPGKRCLR